MRKCEKNEENFNLLREERKMKFYVIVDMEGISGIYCKEQVQPDNRMYAEGRKLLTQEVNAVVEGLLAAGAEEIIVKDAHFRGSNFIVEELHPGARYVMGGTGVANRMAGLDSSFDGALLIGYHAMSGVEGGVLEHTMSSQAFTAMSLNGRPIGEIGIDGLLFGLQGVPVIFVSGDDKACAEAQEYLGAVHTYETKTGLRRNAALMKPPQLVHREIAEAVRTAVMARGSCRPYRVEGPYEMVVQFTRTEMADGIHYDGVNSIRIDGLTAKYKDTDLTRLFVRAL
jgi:D-amino peptidase